MLCLNINSRFMLRLKDGGIKSSSQIDPDCICTSEGATNHTCRINDNIGSARDILRNANWFLGTSVCIADSGSLGFRNFHRHKLNFAQKMGVVCRISS